MQGGASSRWAVRGLDKESPIPLYYQLQELLKQEIEGGTWGPGETLPSEAELQTALGISRTVIRKALDVLEGDGQVRRIKGKGTVVCEAKLWYERRTADRVSVDLTVRSGFELARILDVREVPAGRQLARVLAVDPDHEIGQVTCVHATAGKNVSLAQIFFRTDTPSVSGRELGCTSLLTLGGPEAQKQLEALLGEAIVASHISVEATFANDFEAEVLEVRPAAPVFLIATVDRTAADEPVIFTREVVRADLFRIAARVTRDPSTNRVANAAVASDREASRPAHYVPTTIGGGT
jgi:GntR family transcriptional regulator